MGFNSDMLLEPSNAFKTHYKESFKQNANELFDSLAAESGINADQNRRTAADYRKKAAEVESFKKKRGRVRALQITLIVIAVISALVLIYGIFNQNVWLIAVPSLLCTVSVVLLFTVIRKKLRTLKELLEKLEKEAKSLYDSAIAQIMPLLVLFDNNMTYELIRKTVPELELDDSFDMKRYDYMHEKYGLSEQPDDESSTLGVLSGQIVGNPFMFERVLRHKMGLQTYTGTKIISWTTYSRDSKGRTQSHHHTQTLVAHVRKPKPFFTEYTRLIYGNDAAPDLHFTRKKTHCERLSEKQLKSEVNSRIKSIRKKAKDMTSGFTEVGNQEFDALFGAIDRDNEVQFRLLFTPLAQKNMLGLMKGGSPYGDDFDFMKRKCLNCIISEHSQNWNMDTDTKRYRTYDIDICRKLFVEINLEFFTSMYFDLAPLLSIPMYQQIKPAEYIYGNDYPRNYTARETEILANRLNKGLVHPASFTKAILKTELIGKTGNVDKVRVTAYSYRGIHRVDFVMVHGGDGRMHAVPVPWIQYIPLSKQTEMSLKKIDMTEREFRHSKYNDTDAKGTFYHKLFATLGEDGELHDDSPGEVDESKGDFGDIVESDLEEFDDGNQHED